MIQLCLSVYDRDGRYTKFVGTTIRSILDHTREKISIYILHDSTFSLENRNKLLALDSTIEFYNVESRLNQFESLLSSYVLDRFSLAAFYRLVIPEVLPQKISRVIYLDADIIVNLDLAELWKIDLAGNSIAAKPFLTGVEKSEQKIREESKNISVIRQNFVSMEDLFNSGVLILNLDKLRKTLHRDGKFFIDGAKRILDRGEIHFTDQEIMNILFQHDFLRLPRKFNFSVSEARLESSSIEQAIYHYVDHALGMNLDDEFNLLWFKTFIRTPWFSPRSFENLFNSCKTRIDEDRHNLIRFTKIFQTRRRAFFIHENQKSWAQKTFSIDSNDLVIIFSGGGGNLVSVMQQVNEQRPKQFIFMLLYPRLFYENQFRKNLERSGFVEFEDFVNIYDYLDGTLDEMQFIGAI